MTGAGRRFPYDPATLRMAQEAVQRLSRDPAVRRQIWEANDALRNSNAWAEIMRRNRQVIAELASPAFARQWAEAVRTVQATDPDLIQWYAEFYRTRLDTAAVRIAAEDLAATEPQTVEEAIEAVADDPEAEATAEEAATTLADSHLLDDVLVAEEGSVEPDEDSRAADIARITLVLFVMFVGGGLIGAGLALPALGAATNNVVGVLALCAWIAEKILSSD